MAEFSGRDESTQQARIAAVRGKNVLFITCFLATYLYDRDLPQLKRIASWGPNLHMVFGTSDEDRKAKRRFEVYGGTTVSAACVLAIKAAIVQDMDVLSLSSFGSVLDQIGN